MKDGCPTACIIFSPHCGGSCWPNPQFSCKLGTDGFDHNGSKFVFVNVLNVSIGGGFTVFCVLATNGFSNAASNAIHPSSSSDSQSSAFSIIFLYSSD